MTTRRRFLQWLGLGGTVAVVAPAVVAGAVARAAPKPDRELPYPDLLERYWRPPALEPWPTKVLDGATAWDNAEVWYSMDAGPWTKAETFEMNRVLPGMPTWGSEYRLRDDVTTISLNGTKLGPDDRYTIEIVEKGWDPSTTFGRPLATIKWPEVAALGSVGMTVREW